MSRPTRNRIICKMPRFNEFSPCGNHNSEDVVVLQIDEFEVIRLIDYEGKTQEECALLMDVSRTTVTDIYNKARYKISNAIINGLNLLIYGGSYELCDGNSIYCKKDCAIKKEIIKIEKGDNSMRIAVTYENGEVFQHFGHTAKFKFYDVENNVVVNEIIVDTNGSGHGALAGFLSENKVDTLICGGIGGGAKNALAAQNIKLFGGVVGNADEAVQAFINGNLEYNANVHCDHHDHEEGHICGDHGCGSHKLYRTI